MKHTVILKWNPAVSSYNMIRFLDAIVQEDGEMNWSIWEHEVVRKGDIFYMLKVGQGQTGIVMRGKITSDPETGEDWSRQGRKTYYCNYKAEIMLSPDVFRLLDSETLRDNIPDFDWFAGHSGMVLDERQSTVLDRMWTAYLQESRAEFQSRLDLIARRNMLNDQLYLAPAFQKKLFSLAQ